MAIVNIYKNNSGWQKINLVMLLICLLFTFNFFTPHLQSFSTIYGKEVATAANGGINFRSAFWLSVSSLIFCVAFLRGIFRDPTWFKTYIFLVTVPIFLSITWSANPFITFSRAVLWLAAGGAIAILYLQEYRQGDLKGVFIKLSALLLMGNCIAIVFFPAGAFAAGGALSGIFSGKNTMGAVAGLFTVILSSILIQYKLTGLSHRITVKAMILLWLLFLALSVSKSSIAITAILTLGLYFFHHRMRFLIYLVFFMMFILLSFIPLLLHILGLDAFSEYSRILPPEMFTGRGQVWAYIFEEFINFFWLGVGYGSYWSTGEVRDVFDIEFSFLQILNSSHQGYIHVFSNLGVIGLSIFLVTTIYKLVKFGHRLELWEIAILVFVSFHALFETDFFIYKYTWILFCAILSRIEFSNLMHSEYEDKQ
jgi:O-antigen ligase